MAMIKENLDKIRQRISQACVRAGTDPCGIMLVCVAKGRSDQEILEAIDAGITLVGENRVQEASQKYKLAPRALWHMVGHLQSNKVKEALKIFDLIHSVDSLSLAQEINRQAFKINKVQDILLEVKTSPEETKSGFAASAVARAAEQIAELKQVRIKGLMTIAALGDSAESARPYFSALRRLRDKLNPDWLLSMGMSDDFEVAIEEGANIIRLGRAVFEGDA